MLVALGVPQSWASQSTCNGFQQDEIDRLLCRGSAVIGKLNQNKSRKQRWTPSFISQMKRKPIGRNTGRLEGCTENQRAQIPGPECLSRFVFDVSRRTRWSHSITALAAEFRTDRIYVLQSREPDASRLAARKLFL